MEEKKLTNQEQELLGLIEKNLKAFSDDWYNKPWTEEEKEERKEFYRKRGVEVNIK